MNTRDRLKQLLIDTFEDRKIDTSEKTLLFKEFMLLDRELRSFVRNRAFEMVRAKCNEEPVAPLLKWLESVVKSLDNSEPERPTCEVAFSPGQECLDAILNIIRAAKKSIDVCVFTLSDNRISDELLRAKERHIKVRIITDNDKRHDEGSDIYQLMRQQISVRIDNTRHHMHHKFVISDCTTVATGSFNWTRSASKYNHENIVILDDVSVVQEFSNEFERLWLAFS